MKVNILLLFLLFNISYGYIPLVLNKIYLQVLTNDSNTDIEINETIRQKLDDLEEYNDLPLNNSELNLLNQSYIKTKNINSTQYTVELYLGSNKQIFRLLLSTSDDFLTVSSINCKLCNVSNKYNSALSKTNKKLDKKNYKSNFNKSFNYEIFQDSIHIPSESIKNDIIQKNNINISSLYFKVIELDSSGFLNSDLIDGILSLKYSSKSEIQKNNFIRELYNERIISSPSFSIIITSTNINRLYLGDIMKNEYVRYYLNSSMNKGECKIIDDNWRCRLSHIEYNALRYNHWEQQIFTDYSILTFNLKENKLTIPEYYYDLIVVGYRYVTRKVGDTYVTSKESNKWCRTYGGIIYCSCSPEKDNFGILTFHFENNSTLDLDLREFVYYDKKPFIYKCKVDIVLSKKKEFIVGLKGFNNTILSFNMEDKKIKFFHKKKFDKPYKKIKIIIFIICIILLIIANYIKIVYKI